MGSIVISENLFHGHNISHFVPSRWMVICHIHTFPFCSVLYFVGNLILTLEFLFLSDYSYGKALHFYLTLYSGAEVNGIN